MIKPAHSGAAAAVPPGTILGQTSVSESSRLKVLALRPRPVLLQSL
jgi:hypothetical protein